MKKIIMPIIHPKTQYNCQHNLNIIDEVVEIRDINRELSGKDNKDEKDGTIISIDFSNAFRSTSLRWFNLVMKRLNIPREFMKWFWMMYENLIIMIKVNNEISKGLKANRGFIDRHHPNMAAFVIQQIPLMIEMEKILQGSKQR